MAKVLDLPKISAFSLGETSTISQRWSKWVKAFEYYIAASGITDKKQQRAVLLHLAGPEVQHIFETLEDTGNDLDTAITKLTAYFQPQKNIPFERHNFRQTTQLQGETIEQYAIRLKHQVKFCDYNNPADMIRDQIIEQCLSTSLRRRLLREPDLTLEKTITIGRSFEASERQASQMEADSLKPTNLEVNAIQSQEKSPRFPGAPTKQTSSFRSSLTCYCCGNIERKILGAPPKACPVTTATNLGISPEYVVNHDRQVSLKIKIVKIYLEMKSTNKRLEAIATYVIFPVRHFLRPRNAPLMKNTYSNLVPPGKCLTQSYKSAMFPLISSLIPALLSTYLTTPLFWHSGGKSRSHCPKRISNYFPMGHQHH